MIFTIRTIPHEKQRYNTIGDWETAPESRYTAISVTQTGNDDYDFLIGIHELVEAYMCQKEGITQQSVDEFDINFEKEGRKGEPGDAKDAPYRKQHKAATQIEKKMALLLGIDWKKYDKAVQTFTG